MPLPQGEGGLSRYLTEIRKFPLLSADEEAECARRWRNHNDQESAYRLVTSHLRLAAKIALRYRGYGLPVADLISEANLGLMLAVKRFEPEKGCRLATYAMWWIKSTVQEYVLRSWSLVKIGTTAAQKKLFFNLRKLKNRISASEAGDLSPEQVNFIAHSLEVEPREVIEMNGRMRGEISLNAHAIQDAASEEMQEFLIDPSADPEGELAESEEREQLGATLRDALTALSSRERTIIEARFLADERVTFEELGRRLGVSRERIRQIEVRALQKLRMAMRAARAADGWEASRLAGEQRCSF
jgi:RNA polymerase sigma-32 factor